MVWNSRVEGPGQPAWEMASDGDGHADDVGRMGRRDSSETGESATEIGDDGDSLYA